MDEDVLEELYDPENTIAGGGHFGNRNWGVDRESEDLENCNWLPISISLSIDGFEALRWYVALKMKFDGIGSPKANTDMPRHHERGTTRTCTS